MKRMALVVAVALGLGTSIGHAQDSLELDGPRAERLRVQIEEIFAQRLATELGLTADQSARTRGILATWATKRRGLERDERRLRVDLSAAMRPGVAADEAAVTRLVDAILNGRLAYMQTFKDENAELAGVLSPVQRAQYILLRDRLMQRVQQIRNQRQAEGVGPGARLRARPPR